MSSQKTRPFELPAISRNASDLIIELKDLNERLQTLEQEEDEFVACELRSKLAPIAAGLVEHKWMLHRDKIVRLMVACCLSQILRLYAPDPPFGGETLSRVFSLFVQQLRGLSEPNGTYYSHYFGLLEGLATVKSVVLVWEVPEDEGRDLILLDLFKTSMALVHPKLGQSVRVYLLELLEAVIGESPTGSSLSDQTIQLLLENLQAERYKIDFINDLVQMCSQAIAPMFGRYFTDILVSHASTPAWDQVRQVHNQLSLINSTDALSQVIPQIVHELQVEQTEMRTLAIQTLAAVFCNAKQGKMFGGAWTAWLGRKYDKVQGVRGHWVAKAVEILPRLVDSQSQEELAAALAEKLLDPEERIRERVLVSLDQDSNLESLPKSLLEAVTGRCLDLKEDVRVSALSLLSSLLSKLDISSESSSRLSLEAQARKSKWSFLAQSLICLCRTEDQDARLLFEYFLEHSCLTSSQPTSPSGSMDLPVRTQALRWVWMWSCLDERGRLAFTAWIRAKSQFVKLTHAYLQLAMTQTGTSHQLSTVLQYLASRFRSPVAAQSMLTALVDNEEMRQSLAVLVNPNVSTDTLRKTLQTVTKMHDPKIKAYLLQYLATRASWISVSRELVTELLGLTQVDPSVPQLVELLMTEMPTLAANHGNFLLEACIRSDYGASQLKSLYQFIKSSFDHSALSGNTEFVTRLEEIMDAGTCRHQVKMAARILLLLKPEAAASIVESAVTDTAHPDTLTKLRAWQILSVLGQEKPSLFPPYLEELLLEYEVILSDVAEAGHEDLVIVSTRFWGHHLPVMPTPMLTPNEQTFGYEVSLAILKALKQANKDLVPSMLKNLLVILGGEGVNLAYLFTNPVLLELFGDASDKTIAKVTHLVAYRKTSPLVLLPVLVEMNKEAVSRFKGATQQSLQNWIRTAVAEEGEEEHLVDSGSIRLLEDLMVPLLVLLSRPIAPEASIEARLTKCRAALNLFFDLILTQDNVSYLFALAVEVKRYHVPKFLKDQVSGRTLYLCSEVAQSILRQKATWMHVSLQAFPLPLRIIDTTLAPLEPHLASQNLTRSYLARANSRKDATKKRFGKKSTGEQAEPVVASASTSPKRRNPGRNVKLPAGTLEALLSHDGSDVEMMSDEEEAENMPDNDNKMTDVVPLKRKARLSNEPSEIILGIMD